MLVSAGAGDDMGAKNQLSKLTAFDLFSGCGGLTCGLKAAGFRVLGALDVDAGAVECYSANHPDVLIWQEDIRTVDPAKVLERIRVEPGNLDLLAGCPPCQGFSSLRTLNGSRAVDDPRNALIREFARFVEGMRPRAVLMENVPGLAAHPELTELVQLLEKLGYVVRWRVLDAYDYGVPQRRRRLILLAGLGVAIRFPRKYRKHRVVADVIHDLPEAGASGDPAHDISERRSQRVMDLIARIPKDGGSRNALDGSQVLRCHRKCDGFKDVYGRMAWNRPAPTITSGFVNPSKGRFLHPEYNRTITLREASLLQGFPPGYVFPVHRGKFHVAALIGNAVPPEFAKAQAMAIKRSLLSS